MEQQTPADEETNAAIAELQQLAGAGGDGETATDHATFMAALDRNIAAREEQREREQLVNGIYALGDRVDTREEVAPLPLPFQRVTLNRWGRDQSG